MLFKHSCIHANIYSFIWGSVTGKNYISTMNIFIMKFNVKLLVVVDLVFTKLQFTETWHAKRDCVIK